MPAFVCWRRRLKHKKTATVRWNETAAAFDNYKPNLVKGLGKT